MLKVLLIEDELLFAKSVARRLERDNFEVKTASTLFKAREYLNKAVPDAVLLDVRLSDGNGLELLAELRSNKNSAFYSIPVIVMTAYGELDDAVSSMKLGATDYLKKPVDLDELQLMLSKVLATGKVQKQLDYSLIRNKQAFEPVVMAGNSQAVTSIKAQLSKIAGLVDKSQAHHPVLLVQGETGTGKDVAARYFHQVGSWNNKPFVHVDCASLPKDLIEAELFGHERGAFTNAHQTKIGLIEVAEEGTVFLDEIGELPLQLQAKLLNVLERRVLRRIGANKEIEVPAHFVAATNRNLTEMVAAGTFREDLFFRLNILEITLPPLRDRESDMLALAEHFIGKLALRYALATPKLSQAAREQLVGYSWPGNIRELQHVLERAVMLCQNGIIQAEDLLLQTKSTTALSSNSEGLEFEKMTLDEVEKYLIQHALERTSRNVSQAARELGLTRMAMRYRMDKYQL